MRRRIQLLSKLVLALFVACTLASSGAWFILLTTICSNPRRPMPETQHVIPYSCHGMMVFITPLQNAMRHWLIPIGLLFVFLTLLAAALVVLAAATVRIDVQIHRVDAARGSPDRKGERD